MASPASGEKGVLKDLARRAGKVAAKKAAKKVVVKVLAKRKKKAST
jgi:hypothetical protein